MKQYLVASEFIDFDHHLVARKAQDLADGASDQHDLIVSVKTTASTTPPPMMS